MLAGYSKLFIAGLSFADDDGATRNSRPRPRSDHSTLRPSIRSSWPPRHTRNSTSTSVSIFSPVEAPTVGSPDEMYFTLKSASRSSLRPRATQKAVRRNENEQRSFLSLDLAESTRSMSIRSRRQLRLRGRSSITTSTNSITSSSQHSFLFPSSVASASLIHRRRSSAFLPKPKPLPLQLQVLPLPPVADSTPHTAPPGGQTPFPRTPTQQITRKLSIATTATASTSVKRANRFDALAALEGRHKHSFWDEEDIEEEVPALQATSTSTSSTASTPVVTTPAPFRDLINLTPTRATQKTKTSGHRRRASTMESWFVPPASPLEYFDNPNVSHTKDADVWQRLAGMASVVS